MDTEKKPHFNKGKVRSKELRERISATLKSKGGNQTTFKKGHTFTEEVIKKMRGAQKGERSHAWKHGLSLTKEYGRDWQLQKKEKKAGRKMPEQCEICCVLSKDLNKRLCYDHCHRTGEFRGWICNACNTALGMVRDNTKILEAMIKYLDDWRD